MEAALSKRSLPTHCLRDEKIFRTIILKAASHYIPTGRHGFNNSCPHVVETPRGRSFIWQIGVNSSIQDRRHVDRVFFMELSQSCAATLTYYSTEPLTTGPDYDPLLLLLALAGDEHPNPGPPRYPCSVCFKNVTSQGISYLCTRC